MNSFRISFFRILIVLLSLAGSRPSWAQTYPVQVSVNVIPPYQNYFASYANEDRLKIFLTFTDFNSPAIQVRLKLRFDSPNFDFESNPVSPTILTLYPGVPVTLTTQDLQTYFQNNLPVNGPQNNLTEGPASFCIEVYNLQNNELLNNTSCGYFFLQYGQPAQQQLPSCNGVVPFSEGDNSLPDPINFSFAPPIAPIGLQTEVQNKFYLFNYNDQLTQQNLQIPTGLIAALNPAVELPFGSNTYTLLPFENNLVRGNQYVWYIHSSLPSYTNQFQNSGWSAPCIFTYDEAISLEENLISGLSVVWNDGDTSGTDPNPGLIADGESKAYAKWKVVAAEGASTISFNHYILSYRKKSAMGEETFDWFHDTVQQLSKAIYQLEPATTYEAYVRGVLGTAETDPTETREITTQAARTYACGVPDFPGRPTVFQPLAYADPGMKVQIGMFQLEFTEVQPTGEPGHFAGTGLVPINFLMGAEAKVRFDDLKIDEEYNVWDGTANVITQGLDAWLEDQYQQFQDPIWVNGTVDSAYVSDSVAHVIINGVDTTFSFPCPTCPVIINDVVGNQVTIYPNGTVIWSTYLDVSDETLDVPDTEIAIFEQNEDEIGGFDAYVHTQWHENYEIIRTNNSVNYFVANKSMHEGQTDKVNLSVPKNEYGANDVQLSWEGLTTPLQPTSSSINGNNRVFVFDLPAFDEAQYDVYAISNSVNSSLRIGKLNLHVYETLEKNIVIVPLAGTVNGNDLASYLNETLGEAGINFTVTTSDTVGISQFATTIFNVPDATLMTKYGSDMREVRNTYFENRESKKNTYYLFVVAGLLDTVSNNNVDGYMVRGKSVGFITTSSSNQTIVHELGHGVGALEHTWNNNGPEQESTDNLMDYGNSVNLIFNQWEALRAPKVNSFWDEEEDGEKQMPWIAYYFWELNSESYLKPHSSGISQNSDNIFDFLVRLKKTSGDGDLQKRAPHMPKIYDIPNLWVAQQKVKEKIKADITAVTAPSLQRVECILTGTTLTCRNAIDYVMYINHKPGKGFYIKRTSPYVTLVNTSINYKAKEHYIVVTFYDSDEKITEQKVYDYNANLVNQNYFLQKGKATNVMDQSVIVIPDQTSLSKLSATNYDLWKDLLQFENSSELTSVINTAKQSNLVFRQPMKDANGVKLNTDYYAIKIYKNNLGSYWTMQQIFLTFRTQMDSHFDPAICSDLRPYSTASNAKWVTTNPVGAIMTFEGMEFGLNVDDSPILVTQASMYHSVFTPIWAKNDGYHTLTGHREFGIIENNDDSYTLYTRGVDLQYPSVDVMAAPNFFDLADRLWTNVMLSMIQYMEQQGAKAQLTHTFSRRINWLSAMGNL